MSPGQAQRNEHEPRGHRELSWTADLRRRTLCAVGIAIGATVLLLLASTGLMVTSQTSGVRLEADAALSGVLAGVGALMWAYLPITPSRPGFGYRHTKLPSLLVLGLTIATLVDLVVICIWPVIVGPRAPDDSVIATVTSNPLSLPTIASFVIMMHALSAACVLGFVRGGWVSSVVIIVPFLAVIGLALWQGLRTFEDPPTTMALLVRTAVAVVSVVGLAALARFVGPEKRGIHSTANATLHR